MAFDIDIPASVARLLGQVRPSVADAIRERLQALAAAAEDWPAGDPRWRALAQPAGPLLRFYVDGHCVSAQLHPRRRSLEVHQVGRVQVDLAHAATPPTSGAAPTPASLSGLRVGILEDQQAFRESLVSLLEDAQAQVMVSTADMASFLEQVEQEPVQVAIIDLRLGAAGGGAATQGLEALRVLRERSPAVHCLVLSSYQEARVVERCFAAGASGYLSKLSVSVRETLRAVAAVSRGERVVSPDGLLPPDHPARFA
jgi:CheY-like chemotaxis protein